MKINYTEDGLPIMEDYDMRVVFISNGQPYIGWWEIDFESRIVWKNDEGFHFLNVTHWIGIDEDVENYYDEARLKRAIEEVNQCLKRLPYHRVIVNEEDRQRLSIWKAV